MEKLENYIVDISGIDCNQLHFFDESSVVVTSGKRRRGHSAIGTPAIEVQRYASNATYTVNLLHNIRGVSHFNILRGPSNGLELLNFFEEALEQENDSKWKILVTGSIPMENLPTKSHDVMSKKERRTLLDKIDILPWTVNDIDSDHETLKLEFYDGAHGIAKFTVTVKAGLDFTVFVYHWPIPDNHRYIYTQDKRLLNSIECVNRFLNSIDNSNLCNGVPKEFNSVAVDPTWD
ncbi:Hypothetical predicted protein [Paramuricea clavata]|uniref:Uncharacterized protein n=1 Tax=Paramuricea clavata TaxID=317549 RepID=A0A7D9DE45_PARCT|nr:Hypothetical predicted protein [Paramuricea clavata]